MTSLFIKSYILRLNLLDAFRCTESFVQFIKNFAGSNSLCGRKHKEMFIYIQKLKWLCISKLYCNVLFVPKLLFCVTFLKRRILVQRKYLLKLCGLCAVPDMFSQKHRRQRPFHKQVHHLRQTYLTINKYVNIYSSLNRFGVIEPILLF